jgi:chemotaxis protein MotB
MSGGAHSDRRRGGGSHARRRKSDHGGHDGGDERWLLTYADMITLLMALFIVMWAISSVNTTKFAELSVSLKQAFNGKMVDGGSDVVNGATSLMPAQPGLVGDAQGKPVATDPISVAPPAAKEFKPITVDPAAHAVQQLESADAADLEGLTALKKKLDRWSAERGLKRKIDTTIDERGLVIRVLTDDLLFDSGQAVLKPTAHPILAAVASFLRNTPKVKNDVRVEGNTDNVPIHNAAFHSNWELSAARATAVLEDLLRSGVGPRRLSATAYGDQRPITTNASAAGRSTNRRVELVVLRRALSGLEGATS